MVKLAHEFLGHHIQQYPAGKHRSSLNTFGELLGFNTLITPQ
jgi:RNA-directed DNA polymerase